MRLTAGLLLIACVAVSQAASAEDSTPEWKPDPLRYAQILLDENDVSYFADVTEPFELKSFAPPAGPIGVGEVRDASSLVFTSADGNWIGDWHPTPRLQYVLVLRGTVEIRVESGETRSFGPGSIVYLGDVRGKGHDSKIVGDLPALFAMIAVPEATP